MTLPGAESSRRTESEGNTGAVPSPATIRQTFTVPAGEVEASLDVLAEEARRSGWSLEPRPRIGLNGAKRVGGFDAQLVIAAIEPERTVWIELSTRDE